METPVGRRVMVTPQGDLGCAEFVAQACQSLVEQPVLDKLRALYKPPPKPVIAPPVPFRGPARGMGPYSRRIYEEGPLEGMGRGHTLYKLACHLQTDGVDYATALGLCAEADVRWGKFHERPNGHVYVERAVQKAYGYS